MNTPAHHPAPQRKKPGCLFYGCLTAVILALIVGVGVGLGVWYGVKKLNEAVEQFTSTSPQAMPAVEMADDVYAALEKRVAVFGQALKDNQPAEVLVLTGDEINALLARSSSMQNWKGKLHVMIDENQVRGQVSLPLDPFAQAPFLSKLKGRYLNGSARLGVGMENGRMLVRILGMEVNGQTLQAELVQALQKVNLVDEAYSDPKLAQELAKIGRVEVTEGQLVITPSSSQ